MTGLAWALVHPLLLLAVYHFVFTSVFRMGAFEGKSFLLFVAVALWPWLAAQEGLQRATVAIAEYGGLIRKVAFPHEIAIYASVAATLALQFAGYLAVLLVLFAFGEPVHFEGLLLAVPIWVVLALAVTGIALALAALQVFVRDVAQVLAPVLIILMYLTPILYPLALVPGRRATVGRRESVRLAGRPAARRVARRPACDAMERRGRARHRDRPVLRGPLGVPPVVAAFRGLRVSAAPSVGARP